MLNDNLKSVQNAGFPRLISEIPRVLFLDMNTFYASVVQELEPKYRGKPLVITQVKSQNTTIIASSPEAKAFGIKTGMKLKDALKLCSRELKAVATEFKWNEIFRDYHFKILDIVNSIVPADEVIPYSIDELAWIPKTTHSKEYLLETADLIRAAFREELGDFITASIGIAPNVYLAKVASETDKRNGIVLFDGNYFDELLKLKLTDLPYINHRKRSELKKMVSLQLKIFYS